jgi:hypothetical protein
MLGCIKAARTKSLLEAEMEVVVLMGETAAAEVETVAVVELVELQAD